MLQIFISSAVISCPGQDKPMISFTNTLSIGNNGEFIRVEEIGSDQNGNIYVTDAYRFNIKKFSPTGILLREYGKRGDAPADFSSPPYKIICHDTTVAVVAKGTARIQLFNETFTYTGQITLPGVITDLIFDKRGRIVAGIIPYDHSENGIIFLLEKSGRVIASARSNIKEGGPASDMIHISAGKGNTIIAACRFNNIIALYTETLKLIKIFSAPDLLPEAPSITATNREIGIIPEGDLIKDIGSDRYGNIYILSGDFDDIPNRIVYLFGSDGIFLDRFQLPQKSGILYVDDHGNIYTRENQRTLVRKYVITHHNNGTGHP